MQEWSRGGGRNDRRTDDRRRQRRRARPARRHRRDGRPAALAASPSPSASARACSSGASSACRGKRPAALREIPPLPGDELNAARKRRRHLRAGLLRRPPGRLPRDPQPGPDRPRHGGDALVPARLRPHRQHQPQPGDAAQPDGLQGRHRQHQGRGHRGDGPLRLGRRRRPGLDARRQLPGQPPHPDAARGLGPLGARRPGADDRPGQVQAARRWAAAKSSTRSTSRPKRTASR